MNSRNMKNNPLPTRIEAGNTEKPESPNRIEMRFHHNFSNNNNDT